MFISSFNGSVDNYMNPFTDNNYKKQFNKLVILILPLVTTDYTHVYTELYKNNWQNFQIN
ncbi:hypothetical protein DFP78_102588 [Photobacterium lutimaris]|nr:hypothetical protein DFP78_102588 [Photobacterium lutimaris]